MEWADASAEKARADGARPGKYGSDAESAAEPGCAYDDRDTDADLRGERTAGVGGRGGFPQCGTAAGAVLRMAAAL